MVTPPALFLTPIYVSSDTLSVCYAKIQAQVTQAVNTAGISYTMADPLLRNIQIGTDTETVCLAIIQRWLAQLTGGGSGGGPDQAGIQALAQNATSVAITFSPAFPTACLWADAILIMPGGGQTVLCNLQSVSASGFTAYWGVPLPKGNYSLSWRAKGN